MGCVEGNCFYPNFAMVVHRETCPCLLQLIDLSLPLFSFLQLLKPVFLPFVVPWVHSPNVILCALSSQFSSILPHLSCYSVTFQLLVCSVSPLFGFCYIPFFFLSLTCKSWFQLLCLAT